MLVRLAWTGPPALARKLALSGTPAQPRYAPLQVLFESGLIVWSYSGSRLLRGLTFPLQNVKDIKKVRDFKKSKSCFSKFSNFQNINFSKLKKFQNFVYVTAIWLFLTITTFALFGNSYKHHSLPPSCLNYLV